jgi:hypothetical protein
MLGNIVGLQEMHANSLRSPFTSLFVWHVLCLNGPLQTASARGLDPANTDLFNRVMSVARPLYRSYLTCQNAFPAPDMKNDWLDYVWCEACERTGVNPFSLAPPHIEEASLTFCRMFASFHVNSQIVVGSTTLLSDMKTRIMHLVESSYGFDASGAPDSISRNAMLARGLLAKKAFICRVRPIFIAFNSPIILVLRAGAQHLRDSSTPISTPDHPRSHQYDMVPEQERRRGRFQ